MMRFLRNFWKDRDGSVPIEGLFGSLLLLGWYIVLFQFYDAFRARSIALRASYTVADMISRQIDAIGPTYMTGAKKVFDYIAAAQNSNYTWMRISLIRCFEDENDDATCDGVAKKFLLDASYSTISSIPVQTATTINQEASRIPMLAAGDSAVVLETSLTYWPIFVSGDREWRLDGQTWTRQGLRASLRFSNFVVTRPRGPRIVWSTSK